MIIARPERMPGSVITAMILIGLILANILLGVAMSGDDSKAPPPYFPVIVTLAVLAGLALRYPVAWSISRSLAVLMTGLALILTALSLVFAGGGAVPLMALAILPTVGMNIAIYVLLSRPIARAYFGVACPSCGNLYPYAAKFGYSLCRCRECHAIWDPRTGSLKAA